MRIVIEVISHRKQRYDTAGDWYQGTDGALHIKVSDMGNDDYAILVAIHELHEAWLCKKRGISSEQVDEFDRAFQGEGEPGDAAAAPYRKEHFFATNLERMFAHELGIDWFEYDKAVMSL